MKRIVIVILFFFFYSSFFSGLCIAQFTDLHDFDAVGNFPNGANPSGTLTISGNLLYGTTSAGGEYGYGVIFSMHTDGSVYKNLFYFNDTLGSFPMGNLLCLGKNLYGMTSDGGTHHKGIIFRIDTGGQGFTILYNFDTASGANPRYGSLVPFGSKFYGLTDSGGTYNSGVLFSIDSTGSGYKVLFNFNGDSGKYPGGGLTPEGNKFYGMTYSGGVNDYGSVFSIDTSGNYRDLHDFDLVSGAYPTEGRVTFNATGKTMYGMTQNGGISGSGCMFSMDSDGAHFNTIHFFNSSSGSNPYGGLLIAGNNLYGMANEGGPYHDGFIFSSDTTGHFSDSLEFNDTNGAHPLGDFVYSGDILFGMCHDGGYSGFGNIFSFGQNALGINTLSQSQDEIKVYPNPSDGRFSLVLHSNFQVDEKELPYQMAVYNMLGKEVYLQFQPDSQRSQYLTFHIDLSAQPNGVYLCRITGINGKFLGEIKLIIQK